MPILPLPQFEEDLAQQDKETYERLKPPSSIVAKFGCMGLIGEFPFSLDVKPGCGTKFVLKTHRGTEIGEMLTSTCPNSGCGKSISRKEMLEYIDRSGGKDYPFFSMQGKVLRVATVEDLNQQMRIDETKPRMVRHARALVERMKLPMKVVDAEPILGGEKVTFYFLSEDRIDFRELVQELATEHQTRIEMRQVGSRDEARLTADYEKCGQHCCCKQFLKVLKPVSMKNAKIQKATLDPLKISGRCGRLMCCLRYEEQSYDDLRARLPKKRTPVQTSFGTGFVLDTQILTQLVLVQLDDKDECVAVALEELTILGPGQGGGQPGRAGPANPESAEEAEGGGADSERGEGDHTAREAATPGGENRGARPEQRPAGGPGGRPQWPSGGKPGGSGGAPSRGQPAQGPRPGGASGAPPRAPSAPRPSGQRPPAPRPSAPPSADGRDEIDDLMSEMETDTGDRRAGAEREPGPAGQDGGGRRRRKRKRRRGGGPGGPPSGPSNAGDGPPVG